MNLSIEQLQELLSIIDKNQAVIIGTQFGPEWLTNGDKELLSSSGVDWANLYSPFGDVTFTQFHLGLLAESLGQTWGQDLTFEQLKAYIEGGQYIPLTYGEQGAVNAIKAQKFGDIKTLGGKIFKDINNILTENSLANQRNLIREHIAQGIANKEVITKIAHTIAEKTGDWGRDFERIVAYNSHLAYEEGKAAMIQRNAGEEDPTVYKNVFDGACNHCINLYLTDGPGSEPRLFKLSQLRANGSNIGRKTKDWLPTIGPIHPYCRCLLNTLPAGWVWDEKKGQFTAPSGSAVKPLPKRKPIRVWIAGKEEWI